MLCVRTNKMLRPVLHSFPDAMKQSLSSQHPNISLILSLFSCLCTKSYALNVASPKWSYKYRKQTTDTKTNNYYSLIKRVFSLRFRILHYLLDLISQDKVSRESPFLLYQLRTILMSYLFPTCNTYGKIIFLIFNTNQCILSECFINFF